ncbi:MAG: cobyrinate a,c-diamide synthase [Nitrospirae bacterium]|nr:cobyrinate a,c-diamide synthase [Nitrospirota bacterium]
MTQTADYSIPRIVVSGLRGGSGKTILSLCLVTRLKSSGYKVTTFKKGPDYIDAGWLAKASGAPCYNLDLFMMSPEQAKQSFLAHAIEGQGSGVKGQEETCINTLAPCPLPLAPHIAVIEGNRGLYDGMDHEGTYSTAELAKLLKAPVIITVDCTKATNTIAAVVLGCQMMDTKVHIGGIVLNQIATARQEALIRKAVEGRCNVPVVGAVPRLKKDPFPERHMGLTPFQEHLDVEKSLDEVAEIGEKYIDVDAVLKIANEAEPIKQGQGAGVKGQTKKGQRARVRGQEEAYLNNTLAPCPLPPDPSLRIGVIRDSAFQFYYQENFEELEKRGAQLIEVSPLREDGLPEIDALYIGGGFPETHAMALAENVNFRKALLDAVHKGLPVYAECGGLMYLGKGLILQNREYPMVGVFSIVFGLERKPQAHGYTIIETSGPNPYFDSGTVLRGHEFHYSHVLDFEQGDSRLIFNVKRGKGIIDNKDGLCYKNVLASYTHLHAIGAPEWADGLMAAAGRFRAR